MEIRPVTQSETVIAADIIQTVFKNYGDLAEKEFSRVFTGEAHPTYAFLAKKGDKAVGVAACLETYFSFDVYAICWVAVLEEHRKQGICEALIKQVENFIKTELLKGKEGTIILSANLTDYYAKLGYEKQGHVLHDGSFIMSKIVNK